MPRGVPYADNMITEENLQSPGKIQELEKRITNQEKEIDEARQAYEDSQLRIEELEQKNYGLQKEIDNNKGGKGLKKENANLKE